MVRATVGLWRTGGVSEGAVGWSTAGKKLVEVVVLAAIAVMAKTKLRFKWIWRTRELTNENHSSQGQKLGGVVRKLAQKKKEIVLEGRKRRTCNCIYIPPLTGESREDDGNAGVRIPRTWPNLTVRT
jgi:hypothetical protein